MNLKRIEYTELSRRFVFFFFRLGFFPFVFVSFVGASCGLWFWGLLWGGFGLGDSD